MNNVFLFRLRRLCAFIIGVVFLAAGIFKLLDPVGAGLVMEGYYRFFHLTFLLPTAKGAAVAFALAESLLGAAMISGVWRKQVAIATTALIVFFTLLTLALAIFNPVSLTDCGCFGEVIHLTNFQTFLKNLILLALAMVAFLPFKHFGKNRKRKYVSFGIAAASIFAFTVHSLTSIPFVDYTEFTPGCELLASIGDDEEKEQGNYKATIIYEKNGQEGAFDLDNLPDSTWTYVRTETILINGADIEDNRPSLSFSDANGNYLDETATVGNALAVSVYAPEKVSGKVWTRIADAVEDARSAGFTPLLLTATTMAEFDKLPKLASDDRSRLSGSTYFADSKTLVTLNRSNGGATWFSDGQLIRKFSRSKLPTAEDLTNMSEDDPTEEMLHTSTKSRLHFQGFLLYVFAILLIL